MSALQRGLAVIGCFRIGTSQLSNAEIARMTGIPKPTVTRIIATLVARGYLRQARDTGWFALGPGVVAPARAFFAALDVRSTARPYMATLAESTNTSVYLATPDGADMLLIETVRSNSTMLFSRLDVGDRVPLAVTAGGRAYWSALDEAARDALRPQLRRAGANDWAELSAGLDAATDEARKSGCCLSIGDWHPHIHSVAVALGTGREAMVLICAAPALVPEQQLRAVVAPRLIETARAIMRDLGGMQAPSFPDAGLASRRKRGARR